MPPKDGAKKKGNPEKPSRKRKEKKKDAEKEKRAKPAKPAKAKMPLFPPYAEKPWTDDISSGFDILGGKEGQLVAEMCRFRDVAGAALSPNLLSVGFIFGGLNRLGQVHTTYVSKGKLEDALKYCDQIAGLGTADGILVAEADDMYDLQLMFDLPTASLLCNMSPNIYPKQHRDMTSAETEAQTLSRPVHAVRKIWYDVCGQVPTLSGQLTGEPILGKTTFLLENMMFEGKDETGMEKWASRKMFLLSISPARVGTLP